MIQARTFRSPEALREHLSDVGFWSPHIAEVLERHGLAGADEPVAGIGGTYPTFVVGDLVVKLFGYHHRWRESYDAEHDALALVATDREIAAPEVLASGQIYPDADAAWPYLIMSRTPGLAWNRAGLSHEQKLSVAMDLGMQARRIHALEPAGVTNDHAWHDLDVTAAARASSLPPHLVGQVSNYLAGIPTLTPVFVHGDLSQRHLFTEQGRLTGIIDWGDAMVTDRHYEIANLFFSPLNCDKTLLAAFLDGSDWPMPDDFADRALAFAIRRQAVGLALHHTMDVFHLLPRLLPLDDIRTLEELAAHLFWP